MLEMYWNRKYCSTWDSNYIHELIKILVIYWIVLTEEGLYSSWVKKPASVCNNWVTQPLKRVIVFQLVEYLSGSCKLLSLFNYLFTEGILQKHRGIRSISENLDFIFIRTTWNISERLFSTSGYALRYRSKWITLVNLELQQSQRIKWNLWRIPHIKKLIK